MGGDLLVEGVGMAETLYSRLGGYDAIAAVSEALLQRLQTDPQLGRFWQHRGKGWDATRKTARSASV